MNAMAVARAWAEALIESPVSREAVLGDLAEIAGEQGAAGLWRELLHSTPALVRARAAAAGESAVAALLVTLPLALFDWAARVCLSEVPLKASADRSWLYVLASAALPAALAWFAARDRECRAPLWWPFVLALCVWAVAAPGDWPWPYRLTAAALIASAGCGPRRPRRFRQS